MQSGRGGMGSHKHGVSGCRNGSGKSPKLRHALKREAEKSERKKRRTEWFDSVRDALQHIKPK